MSNYWIRCAVVRACKTMAQSAIAVIGSACVLSAVDWRMVVSASILAGVLSMLTSVAGLPEVDMLEEFDEDELADDELEDIEEDPEDDEELPQ